MAAAAAAAAAEMAAPVVDAEYLRQVDRARRQLRALISNKGCAPIMLRLAYVGSPLTLLLPCLPAPSARACFCLTRGVRSVRVCLVGLSLGALVLSRALACWSCASLLTLLACEICASGSVLPAPCVVCPGLVRGSGEAIYRATCVRPPALKSEKQGVMNLELIP